MKQIYFSEIFSHDIINSAWFYSHNVSLKPVIFEDKDPDSWEIKKYKSFALSVTKLSGKEGNRSVKHKAYKDPETGEAKSRPDSNTLYFPLQLIQALQDDLSKIDLESVLFEKSN